MTRDEAFREYEEALAEITKTGREATTRARATLHEHLRIIRQFHHDELKAVRAISQKTR